MLNLEMHLDLHIHFKKYNQLKKKVTKNMQDNFYIINKICNHTVNAVKITDAPPVDLMEILRLILVNATRTRKSSSQATNADIIESVMQSLNTIVKSSDEILGTPTIEIIDDTSWCNIKDTIDIKNTCTINWSFSINDDTSLSKVVPEFTFISDIMNMFDGWFEAGEEKFIDLLNSITTPHHKCNIYITHNSFKKCNIKEFYELYNDCIESRIYSYPGDIRKIVRYIYSTADKIII